MPKTLPLGAIIATARVAEVERTEITVRRITALEKSYGDYSPGRFAWYLEDIEALPEQIPCRGALSLWQVPPEVIAQIGKLPAAATHSLPF